MRLLLPAALVACIAAAACSSAPASESASQVGQDLTLLRCQPGQRLECNGAGDGPACTCVSPSCTFVQPTAVQGASWTYVQAWALQTADGLCAPIHTTSGTWMEVGQLPGGGTTSGEVVPSAYGTVGEVLDTCQNQLGVASCCTYVWWPNGFTAAQLGTEVDGLAAPQTQALCTFDTLSTIEPIVMGVGCSVPVGHKCVLPGAGSCGSCTTLRSATGP